MTRDAVVARLRAAGCVFAEEEAHLLLSSATSSEMLDALLGRRVAGEPLEHVLGWAEFCGQGVAVDPGVFVPRRRTELLVRQAVELLPPPGARHAAPLVVDVCCGSGAVGAAVLRSRPDVELHATDVDPAAVRCARRNLAPLGGRVYEGDLFGPLPRRLEGSV
ncbi:MAG: methyltransferase, partial [Actinomycetes bacterium]